MSIFQLWNQNRFQNPISISRDELMRISKISSTATYHKCIKELTAKEYIIYTPSYNPFKGSTLEVLNLDYYTKPIPKKDIKKLKNENAGPPKINEVNGHTNEQVNDQALNKHQTSSKHVPYINNTNSINIVNGQAQKNENDFENFSNKNEVNKVPENELPNSNTIPKEKAKKKLREKKDTEQIPPDWELVLEFFKEKMHSAIEAEKFYNHFQSNGWLVGGKSKMKDWKAGARNWMLNSQKFNKNNTAPQPNHLHTSTQKNYGEPL